MNNPKIRSSFLLVLIIGVLVLSFLIFKPFLYVLVLAVVFAVIFRNFHLRVVSFTRGRQTLAAFLSVFVIVLCIFLPLTFLGTRIFFEAENLYTSVVSNGGDNAIAGGLQNFLTGLQDKLPPLRDLPTDINYYIATGLDWLMGNFGIIFSNVAGMLASALIFLISLYYFLRDGDDFRGKIISLSPLSDSDDEKIMVKLTLAVNSVVRGKVIVAILQGFLVSLGFAIFGIPNPVLWGTLAAVAALIPAIGTAIVLIPAIAYLFAYGSLWMAVGLTVWGILAVGLIDNFLEPKLVGKHAQMHPLVVLLSALGGLALFGPLGFLLGPLTLSLLFALFEIYFYLVEQSK